MVKTTGFSFLQDRFAGLSGLSRSEKRGKDFSLNRPRTERTLDEIAGVNPRFGERHVTFGACDCGRGHRRLPHADHTRVRDVIVQRAFLAAEPRYDIPDITDKPAQNFRPGSPKCPPI